MDKFIICSTLEQYYKKICTIDDDISNIPVYIDVSRKDLVNKVRAVNEMRVELEQVNRCTYGFVFSNEIKDFMSCNVLCNEWIDNYINITQFCAEDTVLAIGLYKDFKENDLLELFDICKRNKIELFFLIGRDISSLSWLIAKQFIKYKNNLPKAIISHKNIDERICNNTSWNIYDNKFLREKNIKKILESSEWSELIFHSHGNEDLMHLAEYTLCGNNISIAECNCFTPACGDDGKCFKENNKLININNIKANKVFLLSCHNIPFSDCCLYGNKYNIVLNAIDGYAKNIIASIAVQSSDTPELLEILSDSSVRNIGVRLHQKMDDIQPYSSIINIGLPDSKKILTSESSTYRLTSLTVTILTRIALLVSSGLLRNEHPIYKLSRKILSDYNSLTRRGIMAESQTDNFEQDIINRVNPLSKKIIEIMVADLNDDLHSFSAYNVLRSLVDKESLNDGVCVCGKKMTSCYYKPELPIFFPMKVSYCHNCGEQQVEMIDMPQVQFTCDKYNVDKGNFAINYQATISSLSKGDVYYALLLPGAVAGSCITERKINRVRFRYPHTEKITGSLKFDDTVILQGYWMKLLIVQNGGISITRAFYNLQ